MKKKEDISVWRFNLHTNDGSSEQIKTFNYCKENNIVGTGWKTEIRLMDSNREIIDDSEFYNRIKQEKINFKNPEGFVKAMKALRMMKKDDLIWTRKNNIYYLCRVTGYAKDFLPDNKSYEVKNSLYDIWHYVPCEFVEIGTEENVIGAIVRSFNMGVVCNIRGKGYEKLVKDFSKSTYNKFTKTNYYSYEKIINKWECFFDTLGALEIEELVGLYMQIKLNYGIYTSTNKKDTKEYEYILFKKSNFKETAKLQVKTSDINLDEYNFGDKVFYFFTTGNYWNNGKIVTQEELKSFEKKNKVVFLSRQDLLHFAQENENTGLLPYKLNWF